MLCIKAKVDSLHLKVNFNSFLVPTLQNRVLAFSRFASRRRKHPASPWILRITLGHTAVPIRKVSKTQDKLLEYRVSKCVGKDSAPNFWLCVCQSSISNSPFLWVKSDLTPHRVLGSAPVRISILARFLAQEFICVLQLRSASVLVFKILGTTVSHQNRPWKKLLFSQIKACT